MVVCKAYNYVVRPNIESVEKQVRASEYFKNLAREPGKSIKNLGIEP